MAMVLRYFCSAIVAVVLSVSELSWKAALLIAPSHVRRRRKTSSQPQTHDAQGLTDLDVKLAEAMEKIAATM